ncbi:MAG: P-loop NTPase [Thermoplasmata archaeon]|jgi:MinD superfamily P-loop ATPase
MAEIVVASGKGGVGKSTVLSSLAIFFKEKNNAIVDGDAEAPNLHLLFDVEWLEDREYKGKSIAVVNHDKCNLCGKCVEVCEYKAIKLEKNRIKILDYICEGCRACVVTCPEKAIEIKNEIYSGRIRIGRTEYGPFISPELEPGQSNSGKLVTEEKNIARSWKEKGIKNILVDSAAGIGCQVIASMGGANYAILVVEPTKSSFSDMLRAYDLSYHFRIKSFIIINKYDINPGFDLIEKFSREEGIEIIGKIPYDKNIPISMARNMPIFLYDPNSPSVKAMKDFFPSISNIFE